ncbi:MAG: glycosyltransferase family 2 protein, partial [Candidatus Omnitrophica bacterium]|nr:glycosyltransferase family 2 protein [Candidatus Omnitrophota bacterium]
MQTLFSIIISTYNRCDHLRTTLESMLLLQVDGSFEYEIIVINNNSQDQTDLIIKNLQLKFNNRLFYYHELRQGKSFALNTAIEKAKGEILIFTDDDVIV